MFLALNSVDCLFMQDDKFIGEAKPVKDVKVKMKPVSDMMV